MSCKNLNQKIKNMREKLHQLYKNKQSLNKKSIVELSQRLDKLLNKKQNNFYK